MGGRAAPWAGGGAWPGPAAATVVMALDVGTWHGRCGGPPVQEPQGHLSGATGDTLDGITGSAVGQPLWELDSFFFFFWLGRPRMLQQGWGFNFKQYWLKKRTA